MADPFQGELVAILPKLRRFAATLAGNQDEGDDLVQEACEKAIRRADSFAPGTRLDSWMYRIIQNCHIDRIREHKRRGPHQGIDDGPELVGSDGERGMQAVIDLNRVRGMIDTLPTDQKVVLGLVSIEGLSYQEAATVLETPIGTIMSRLARARKKLHQLVEGTTDHD